MLRALLALVASIVRSAIARFTLFRSRENQAIVELALRQQLAVYVHRSPRPRLSPLDRHAIPVGFDARVSLGE
jgi:hypothetical protein